MIARYVVYGFETTHDALAGERALVEAAVPSTTIPTPRSLGTLCGIALRVAPEDTQRCEAVLAGAGIRWTARVEIDDRVSRGVSR